MKIIISPAKKMNVVDSDIDLSTKPRYLVQTKDILAKLTTLSYEELKVLWACSDSIVRENIARLESIGIEQATSPALLSYEGIQYKYMAPVIFEDKMFSYVQTHVRILSAFYGSLRPFDTVVPYRLEMQAKLGFGSARDLYQFWGDTLYKDVRDDDGIIINLASKEYSKCVSPYLSKNDMMITCNFVENDKGKLVQKGVYAKMARGEMVRFMAENQITQIEDIKSFFGSGYTFSKEYSNSSTFIFVKG